MKLCEQMKTIAENTVLAYESGCRDGQSTGKKEERENFWKGNQQKGSRKNYQYAYTGFGFNFTNFYPMYDIRPTGACTNMFANWNQLSSHKGSLKARLKSCGVTLDTSGVQTLNYAFQDSFFTELPAIALPAGISSKQIFANNSYLMSIETVYVQEKTIFSGCFMGNSALKNVIFSGVIGQNGLDLSDSPKLSIASLQSILNCLKDYSGTDSVRTVTLGAANVAKLTQQEMETAQAKGWTIV